MKRLVDSVAPSEGLPEAIEREDQVPPEWVREIEQEHATIRTLLSALDARLAMSLPVEAWTRAVGETLSTLVPALKRHFEREERELSPSRVRVQFPKLADRITALNAEHEELLIAFARARQDCIERATDPELPDELRPDLMSAASDLRRHEVEENELLTIIGWFDLPQR
jgi:hemerythrin-like domain-containing protein